MPYVITTTTLGKVCCHGESMHGRCAVCGRPGNSRPGRVTRRAVATLDEARSVVSYASASPSGRHRTQGGEIGPEGGTFGPLPDGTGARVPVTFSELHDRWERVL